MLLGKFDVIDVIDQPDGTAKVILEFDDETKNSIKQMYGWKRWNTKKFEKLLITAIYDYVESQKQKEGSNDGNI
jgi:hypothetical protein